MPLVAIAGGACLLLSLAGQAWAKGENEMYPGATAYVPGQTVRAQIDTVADNRLPTNAQFLREYSGLPPGGRYVVSFRRVHPRRGEIYVWVPAEVGFIRRERSTGLDYLESRLVFEVPSLPSGQYMVRGCWTPCERRSLVGRAEISIGATEREALLLSRISTIHSRAVWMRSQSHQFRDRWNRTKERLEGVRSGLAEAKPLVEDLRNRVWVLERRQDRERLAAATETPEPSGTAIFVGGALVGALGVSLVRLLSGLRGTRSRTAARRV
jgi:hypothetical protein